MPEKYQCPECKKHFTVSAQYTKRKGKCPSCKAVLDLKSLKKYGGDNSKTGKKEGKTKAQGKNTHPLITVTVKHASKLKKYGLDLQKVYALIRKQIVHKKEYEKQKTLLKKEAFSSIIEDIVKLPRFDISLHDRIELWYIVFDLLPYTKKYKATDVVYNVYPRYEYAGLIGLGYVLSGYSNTKAKRRICVKSIRGERTTPQMKELFQEVLDSTYRDEFIRKASAFLKDGRAVGKNAPQGEERASSQIEEDFNFGFSWIAFHLPE